MPQWFGENNLGEIKITGNRTLNLSPSFLKINGKGVFTSELNLNLDNIGLGGLDQGSMAPNKYYNIFVVNFSNQNYLISSLEDSLNYSFYFKIASFYSDSNSNISEKVVLNYLEDSYLDFFSEVNDEADFRISDFQCSNFTEKFISNLNWSDVAYGNNSYLLVGNSNRFAYSKTGQSFTTGITNFNFNSVNFYKNFFILTGNGIIFYSFDGLLLIRANSPSVVSSRNWLNTVFNIDKYYSLASNGDILEYTENSIFSNGSYKSNPCNITSLVQKELAFGNNYFISVGTSVIRTSNLINFQTITSPETFNSITFGKGYFIAVSSNKIYYSLDGSSWNLAYTGNLNQTFKRVRYTGGIFLVVGSNCFLTSFDGKLWANKYVPLNTDSNSMIYGKGTFLSFGNVFSKYLVSLSR
jgi:hypothetical protein